MLSRIRAAINALKGRPVAEVTGDDAIIKGVTFYGRVAIKKNPATFENCTFRR